MKSYTKSHEISGNRQTQVLVKHVVPVWHARCSLHHGITINHPECGMETSTKGTIGPGRRPLAYLFTCVITVSLACAYIFFTTLHQLGAASRIELQPHWLQQASVVLVKVQCQVLNL